MDISKAPSFNDYSYERLKETCLNCKQCKLSKTRTNVVFGTGPTPCNVMAIGEGPGESEDLQGTPFIGRSGKVLTDLFKSIDLNRKNDIYITNIVKCRPPNNRNPGSDEIEACSSFLIRQLQLIKPQILILIGSPAMKTVLGKSYQISKVRGQWFKKDVPYQESPLYIMPIFHPSYLLRNSSKEEGKPRWLTLKDLLEVKRALSFQNVEPSSIQ